MDNFALFIYAHLLPNQMKFYFYNTNPFITPLNMEEFADPLKYLRSLDPSEWPNIPKPLLFALISIKQCLLMNSSKITEMSKKITTMESISLKRHEEIDNRETMLSNMIISTDETAKNRIKEISESLYNDLSVFRQSLVKDVDFKQNSNDSKLNNMQEQLFVMKKTLTALPFMSDVDKNIKIACNETRNTLRKDVIENIVSPEIININAKVDQINSNHDIYISKLQEIVEVLRNNLEVLSDQSNEKYINFEKILSHIDEEKVLELASINKLIVEMNKDTKKIELNFNEKNSTLVKHINDLEERLKELQLRYNDVNEELKKQSEAEDKISKEIAEQKLKLKEKSGKNNKNKANKINKGKIKKKNQDIDVDEDFELKNEKIIEKVVEKVVEITEKDNIESKNEIQKTENSKRTLLSVLADSESNN